MLPSILSREVKEGIRRFLQTTFPSSTPFFAGSLDRLLDEPGEVFKGPYYTLRLPFLSAKGESTPFEVIRFPYRPHHHQDLAFRRLCGDSPRSTLVATGTGSGKTECFLYPVLDYCARHPSRGGIKAIVVYPMNALATDQAKRFARAVHEDPALQGKVRVGMYVGGEGDESIAMSETWVITSRDTMRKDPPDIGLTIESFERRIAALPLASRPVQVIFAIFTDGLENASSRYTWKDLATKIKERQEKDGWQFLFLGANQDAIATAAQMNIHAHNAATASYSDKGVQGSARAFSRKTRALRESLAAEGGGLPHGYPSEDLHRSMDEILREEEGRE